MGLGSNLTLSVSAVTLILSVFVAYHRPDLLGLDQDRYRMESVLKSLIKQEKSAREQLLADRPRVAVGFQGCYDLFVNASDLFDALDIAAPQNPEHFNEIANYDELAKSFAYFFRAGAAAE